MRRGMDFIGVGCVFVCHDGQGRVLLQKRSQACRDEQGCWECGGGSMEFGESFEETVRRELKEEYNVEPLELSQLYVRNTLRSHQGTPTHWIHVIYLALINPAQVQIGEPEKIDALGWFEMDHLPKPLHSGMQDHLEELRKFFQRQL